MRYYHDTRSSRIRHVFKNEYKDMTAPMREASLFRKSLEVYPLHIDKDDLIAGWYGFNSQEEWDTALPPMVKSPKATTKEKTDVDWLRVNGYEPGGYDRVHHELDYRTMLKRGLNAYIDDVREELKNPENSQDKNEYLEAMLFSLESSAILPKRFADLAAQLASETNDSADKARLLRIEAACRKVPMEPASSFFEAVQATYLLRELSSFSSHACFSISLGSFDQYIYPYYLTSKEQGLEDDEVVKILLNLYLLLDEYDGKDCAISVGGVDDNDNDMTNELSYLMIKAEKISKLRSPLFTARINKNTPDKLMRELVSRELFEIGQPSFYSEENCRAAVEGRGIAPEIARHFEISSCMNLIIAGSEAVRGWGCKVNTHLPLELALNNGKPLKGELPLNFKTKPRSDYKNVDEIYEQYHSYMTELFAIAMDWNEKEIVRRAHNDPNVWQSAVTNDCIKRGKDRWDGGAIYHELIIEMMGFANSADAITAIEELVFDQGKYTIEDIVKAAQANYEGYEELHKDLLSCHKFGMNNERADKNACRLLDLNADICDAISYGHHRYLPSLHTLNADVTWGAKRYAFLDGRKAGEAVNKNAGPITAARKAGPTSTVISAGKINQIRYSGGQALDVHISIRNMDSIANKDKIAAYIKTYFELGGLQLQVNGLSPETLQKAYDDPDKYPDLIIRLGGHSRYFNELDNGTKINFIERFKVEQGAY